MTTQITPMIDGSIGTSLDNVSKAYTELEKENARLKETVSLLSKNVEELSFNSCDSAFISFLDKSRLPLKLSDIKIVYDAFSVYGTPELKQFSDSNQSFDSLQISVRNDNISLAVITKYLSQQKKVVIEVTYNYHIVRYDVKDVSVDYDLLVDNTKKLSELKSERKNQLKAIVSAFNDETENMIYNISENIKNIATVNHDNQCISWKITRG